MSAPLTLLDIDDGAGSRLRVEHDPRDGSSFVTVDFDGREAPFRITAENVGKIAVAVFTATHPGFTGFCHLDDPRPVRTPKTRRKATPGTGKRGSR